MQLQADLAQLQLSHSNERSQAQQQQNQLRSALSEAHAEKAAAELKVIEVERQLSDVRTTLDSQVCDQRRRLVHGTRLIQLQLVHRRHSGRHHHLQRACRNMADAAYCPEAAALN